MIPDFFNMLTVMVNKIENEPGEDDKHHEAGTEREHAQGYSD